MTKFRSFSQGELLHHSIRGCFKLPHNGVLLSAESWPQSMKEDNNFLPFVTMESGVASRLDSYLFPLRPQVSGGVPVALQPDVHALTGAGGGAGHLPTMRPPRPRLVSEGPRCPSLPAQGDAREHLACPAVAQTGWNPGLIPASMFTGTNLTR